MSDAPENVRRRMTRCPEGHVFDLAAHAACPTCAAAPAAGPDAETRTDRRREVPTPPPPAWLRPLLIAGAGVVAALIALVVLRGAPKPSRQTPPAIIAAPQTPAQPSPATPAPTQTQTQTQTPAQTQTRPVERWKTVLVIAGRTYECVNETAPDGRYRLGAGCPPPIAGETGVTVVNPDGTWTSRSDAGRTDSGTIEALGADRFIAHTRGGPILWERVK